MLQADNPKDVLNDFEIDERFDIIYSTGTIQYLDDEKIDSFFEKVKNRLVIIAPLGPAENKEEIYRELLEANFMGQDSALGSIGINPEQEEFVLNPSFGRRRIL